MRNQLVGHSSLKQFWASSNWISRQKANDCFTPFQPFKLTMIAACATQFCKRIWQIFRVRTKTDLTRRKTLLKPKWVETCLKLKIQALGWKNFQNKKTRTILKRNNNPARNPGECFLTSSKRVQPTTRRRDC